MRVSMDGCWMGGCFLDSQAVIDAIAKAASVEACG